jgi:hypothetical protein
VQPTDIKIEPGKSATLKITSSVAAGLSRPIDLRVDGLPRGITASFAASRMSSGQSTDLTIAADPSAPPAQIHWFSLEGTASTYQAYALGRIEVPTAAPTAAAPTAAPPRSDCSSAGAPGGALLVILAAAVLGFRRGSG